METFFDLSGKAAIVTGGGSGIGAAISIAFAQRGASVHIFDMDEKTSNQTAEGIKQNGGKVTVHLCDVTDQEKVKKLVEEVFEKENSLDILVNNAGIAHIGNLENTEEKDFDKIFQVNVKGVYNCLYAAIPFMKKSGGGAILNLSSIAAEIGIADRFAYSMSKGAVKAITLSVAKDYINDNIRCNCIAPARVHTPFVDGFLKKNYPGREEEMFEALSKTQPIGRMGRPNEIGAMVLYLCSDEASFVTGGSFPIDGGFLNVYNG